jgi:hypothetical protein
LLGFSHGDDHAFSYLSFCPLSILNSADITLFSINRFSFERSLFLRSIGEGLATYYRPSWLLLVGSLASCSRPLLALLLA